MSTGLMYNLNQHKRDCLYLQHSETQEKE